MMIGGEPKVVHHLDPIFRRLAPGRGDVAPTPGREGARGTAEEGYLHCGPNGAGHFVKMVHNGIEYGLIAAYAEGLNILKHANVGKAEREVDAETTPLRHPEHYQYDFNLPDIAEVWRRAALSPRGCSTSRRAPWPSHRSSRTSRAAYRIQARDAGPSRRPSMRGRQRKFSRPLSTSGSSSAGITRNRSSEEVTPRQRHRRGLESPSWLLSPYSRNLLTPSRRTY
jgi:hypothetical protein